MPCQAACLARRERPEDRPFVAVSGFRGVAESFFAFDSKARSRFRMLWPPKGCNTTS